MDATVIPRPGGKVVYPKSIMRQSRGGSGELCYATFED